jgi:hypothetical protein
MGRALAVVLALVSFVPAAFDVGVVGRTVPVSSSAQPLPLEIEFSVPIEGETDVRLDTRIRVQFSRDVEGASLKDRIRLTYSQSDSAERGEAQPPALEFAFDYDRGTRGLEIRPRQRLERFRNVTLELLEGIAGTDGSVLKPWTLNFTTGGS